MLPKDDGGGVTEWLLAGIGVMWALLAAAWTWIWASIPDKRYVDGKVSAAEIRLNRRMDHERETDVANDRGLIEDMLAPVVERIASIQHQQEVNRQLQDARHGENQVILGEILREVRAIRGE